VDAQREIREFLATRRARISPEQAGLDTGGRKRRVPGLRRAEVAVLAGISVEYYIRLERGYVGGVSDNVLDALAAALQLDEAERVHLLDLVRATRMATGHRHETPARDVRPNVLQIIDALAAPALLHNRRLDILAANALGEAVHSPIFADPARPPNHARFLFLDPFAQEFYVEWDLVAEGTVALFRSHSAHTPNDEALSELIEELSGASKAFSRWWAKHDVMFYGSSEPVYMRHPAVGDISLTFEALELVLDPGLSISVYTADPGSASERALDTLSESAASMVNSE
jgi:transcriptional regulator with XRE-family HTH domain